MNEKELTDAAAQLPKEIYPPEDYWSAIRARIEAGSQGATARPELAWWQRPRVLAAAATLLVVASSGITALALRSPDEPPPAAVTAASSPLRVANVESTPAGFARMENRYLAMTHQLTLALESEQHTLAPETVAKLRESLRIIDAAIVEARSALAADPGNKALVEILASTYDQKIDLLRRTAELARS